MSYGTQITLDLPYTEAVSRVRAALTEQGFGVLTEIDVTATLQAKLGEKIEDYVILEPWTSTAASACCCLATSSSAARTTAPWSRRWTRRSWSASPAARS
jgi:hypothetical protein